MADKTIDQLSELTTLDAGDFLVAYDISEPGTEKIRRITKTNAFISLASSTHNHDNSYYTEGEIDAISGSLNTNVGNMFSYSAGTNTITFKGHLIPDTNDMWNIGSADKRIAELYVSATTVHIGDTATFSGTSLAITGGPSPTNLGQNPTMQASTLILQPFIYNPGGGNTTVDPKLTFINSSGQSYGISFNVADNDFSFDSPAGAAKGNIKTNKLTADTIETTGTTQILFKQAVRTDSNVTLGYDENNTITIKGVVDLRTPITFGYAATLGDGNDNITVNCGSANKFIVTSQKFNINTNGAITASGISTTGDSEVGGNLNVTGNLSVQGDTFTVNTQTVTAEDNLIVINSLEAGAGVTAGTAGIEIERGTSTNYQFLFDEPQDNFRVGMAGALQAVATREDSPISSGVALWNGSFYRFDTYSTNSAFNRDFGTSNTDVARGDHTHGSTSAFPAGTKMVFYQNTAPTGWTIDNTVADAYVSIKGGSNAWNVSGGLAAGTHTQPNHTHTGPSHTHTGPNHVHDLQSHYHGVTVPAHNHLWWDFAGTGSSAITYNSAGSGFYTTGSVSKSTLTGANLITSVVGGDGYCYAGGDFYTANSSATGVNSGGPSTNSTSYAGTGSTGAEGTGATGAGATAATWRGYSAVCIVATKD